MRERRNTRRNVVFTVNLAAKGLKAAQALYKTSRTDYRLLPVARA